MPPVEPASRPDRRLPGAAAGTVVALLLALAACGAEEAKDAAIAELAVGSWACAPDAEGATETPFTVRIEAGGTFAVSMAPDPAETSSPVPDELTGTWAIEGGDLEWGLDARRDLATTRVEDFDSLTLDSSELTLINPGIFESNDGMDDPADEQDVLVDTDGTDSVTLTVPGGEPWTCDRQ